LKKDPATQRRKAVLTKLSWEHIYQEFLAPLLRGD
jgi:hypothetical protein